MGTIPAEEVLKLIEKRNSLESKISKYLGTHGYGYSFFKEYMNPIFEKFPKLESFGWNQGEYYDDQSNYFAVRCDDSDIEINGESEHTREDDPAEDLLSEGKDWRLQASDEVATYLAVFSEDDHKALFGSDTKVVVYKDKIVLEDFEGY